MDRRAFIAALFGGAATMRYADGGALNEPIPQPKYLSPWLRHYSYFFQAELRGQTERRMEIAIERNFLLNRVVWQGPEDTIIGIWIDNLLLAEGPVNFFGSSPLPQPILIPAGTRFSVTLLNSPDKFLMRPAALMLSGHQEITEAEAMTERGALDPDDLEDEYEG